MKSRRKFICLDCNIDTGKLGELYKLHDNVWLAVAGKAGMLCIGCLELRLGRKIKAADFDSSYLNKPRTSVKTNRLTERLTNGIR